MLRLTTLLLWLSTVVLSNAAVALEDCRKRPWQREKPYDYYSPETRVSTGTFRGGLLYLVEQNHYSTNVQLLRSGVSAPLPSDLYFILSTIPNHPGALDAYSRYELNYKTSDQFRQDSNHDKPLYEAECFFNRALSVFPDRGETFKVWGMHYYRHKDYHKAIEMYEIAVDLSGESPELHYNLGMSHFAAGDIESATRYAELAYSKGYPLPALKKKLNAANQN